MAEFPRSLDHLIAEGFVDDGVFVARGGGKNEFRKVDQKEHGNRLVKELGSAFYLGEAQRQELPQELKSIKASGTFILIKSAGRDFKLRIDSLTGWTNHRVPQPKWILCALKESEDGSFESATVWVADKYRHEFLKKFEDFADETLETDGGHPKNRGLVANIASIRQAFLSDLWTSHSAPLKVQETWWELWLRTDTDHSPSLDTVIEVLGWQTLPRRLQLSDRVVLWVKATWKDLEKLLVLDIPLTEIRKASLVESVEDLSVEERDELTSDLANRIIPASPNAPAVCHLDTGVLRTHTLLSRSLDPADHHSIFGGSGTDVHENGHGTAMAGLALYGDLEACLASTSPILLRHRLESVRMRPDTGERRIEPIAYGTATSAAVALPETKRPDRQRVYCLTLSAEPDLPGQPTLWSSALDALAIGSDIEQTENITRILTEPDHESSRLIVVAMGNANVPRSSDAEKWRDSIHDPAHAWNVLTVGAHTYMSDPPQGADYFGWSAVAEAGDLSPHSSNSDILNPLKGPIKPDICMEGGNVLIDNDGQVEHSPPSHSLPTTSNSSDTALTTANATSAATAQASRLAALAMEKYPDLWPETIRALLTHSAEWTTVMQRELSKHQSKSERLHLLRRFGWGVPTEERVLKSGNSAVTVIVQDDCDPFDDEFSLKSLRLHELPWPKEVLRSIGEKQVRLRVTLSYFIEPNPSRRGWRNKYVYASHGLRFDLQRELEDRQDFIRRLAKSLDEETQDANSGDSARWLVGSQARHLGSLHQDEWTGPGAVLADCNNLAVYPTGGWWKNNHRRDRLGHRVRYALIYSLNSAEQEVDLYTPIAQQISIPVSTTIPAT